MRLFLLLVGLCLVTPPLLAQAPAPPAPAPAAAAASQPPTGTPREEVVLLFARQDAADALEQSAVLRSPGWSTFKETGPLAGKTGPVVYALFPRESSSAPATASADVIKAAGSYLAQRGANRLELEPVADFGAGASPEPSGGASPTLPPATPAPRPSASPSPATTPAGAPAADVSSEAIAQGNWQFTGDRGLLLLFVKAGKERQFTSVLETLRSTLEKSPDARRREQARGWRVMKVAGNGPSGTIVYLSVLDPVVHGVNYAPSSVFAEALDGDPLLRAYADYTEALSSFNLIDLAQVRP